MGPSFLFGASKNTYIVLRNHIGTLVVGNLFIVIKNIWKMFWITMDIYTTNPTYFLYMKFNMIKGKIVKKLLLIILKLGI
jgi:hypothetical protein